MEKFITPSFTVGLPSQEGVNGREQFAVDQRFSNFFSKFGRVLNRENFSRNLGGRGRIFGWELNSKIFEFRFCLQFRIAEVRPPAGRGGSRSPHPCILRWRARGCWHDQDLNSLNSLERKKIKHSSPADYYLISPYPTYPALFAPSALPCRQLCRRATQGYNNSSVGLQSS